MGLFLDYTRSLPDYIMVELGWLGIFQIIGALSLFIYGMKVMSEGVQRIASTQLRDGLKRVTQNKVSTFLTGFFTTSVLQSSSAAGVMTVSFVNAGILSLTAAAGIIIGANVGSSVTIWIVTIFGFEYNLFALCLPMVAVAMPFIFVKNGKYRYWAETIIGFAILLISLQFLKSIVPDIQKQEEIIWFISNLGNQGFLSIVLFLAIGIGFTALIQSSSALMALTLTLCLNGWLPFDVAVVMVLGANIGTTVSVEIASWVGNLQSKKAARLHVLFNVLGVAVFLPFLPLILSFISWVMVFIIKTGNPFLDKWAMPTGLAIFYTLFNVVCAIFFLMTMPWFIQLASKTIQSKSGQNGSINFIGSGMNTADLSLPIAFQEIIQQCQRIKTLNAILNRIINYTSDAEYKAHITRADEYFAKLSTNQKATNQYLVRLMENRSSLITSKEIKKLLSINHLVDQIRGTYKSIFQLVDEKREQRIWFGPSQRAITLHRINDATVMLKRIIQLLQASSSKETTWKDFSQGLIDKNQEYKEDEKELLNELERGEMKLPSVIIYYEMAHQLNNINDALISMLEELTGQTTMTKRLD